MQSQKVLAGQRALVTGASSGIGAAVAKAIAAAGAKVIVNYRSGDDEAAEVVGQIKAAGGEALAVQADISQEEQVQAMFARMFEAFGGIDILVNNAGMQVDAPFVEMTLAQWQKVIDVNLTGQFLCAREAARAFIRAGVDKGRSSSAGKIIFNSSVHEIIPWAGHVNYAASKGGIGMLMRSMAQELSEHKIRVNSVAPGAIQTPINQSVWSDPEQERALMELIPYGRLGVVEDIARAVVWLASDDSEYVVGHTLYVDGGMTLYPGFRDGG